jgi:hypothetical protein
MKQQIQIKGTNYETFKTLPLAMNSVVFERTACLINNKLTVLQLLIILIIKAGLYY